MDLIPVSAKAVETIMVKRERDSDGEEAGPPKKIQIGSDYLTGPYVQLEGQVLNDGIQHRTKVRWNNATEMVGVDARKVDQAVGRVGSRYHVFPFLYGNSVEYKGLRFYIDNNYRAGSVMETSLNDGFRDKLRTAVIEAGKDLGFDGKLLMDLFTIEVVGFDESWITFSFTKTSRVIAANYHRFNLHMAFDGMFSTAFRAYVKLAAFLLVKEFSMRPVFMGTPLDCFVDKRYYSVRFLGDAFGDPSLHEGGEECGDSPSCDCHSRMDSVLPELQRNAWVIRFDIGWHTGFEGNEYDEVSTLVPSKDDKAQFEFWMAFVLPEYLGKIFKFVRLHESYEEGDADSVE